MTNEFNNSAKNVLKYAQEEALRFKHAVIGTEHILIGLMIEKDGLAGEILRRRVSIDDVRKQIEKLSGVGAQIPNFIAISPRTKNIIEMANTYSRKIGLNYTGTESMLLALINEGEGIGLQILSSLTDVKDVYNEIMKVVSDKSNTNIGENTSRYSSGTESSNTVMLNKYGIDLNKQASMDKIDPVIGRSSEIERVIQILSRRTKNNPCLIGEPGVGKTAIAEGLAQEIVKGDVPEILKNKRIITLDIAGMVAGAKYRGEFEERLKGCMKEIKDNGNIILFIDELHTIIGAGGTEGSIDASNILKPSLARGEIQVIGATTIDEYKKHIEKDAALERRFQPILVEEPSVEDTILILKGLRDKYEAHHKIVIRDDAIEAAAKLSYRYISDRFLPDKAIDLIDEAASKVRLESVTAPKNLKIIEEKIDAIKKLKEDSIKNQKFEDAAKFRDEEKLLNDKLLYEKEQWKSNQNSKDKYIGYDEVSEVVAKWTGIPVTRLQDDESERLLNMENIIHKRVVGQEFAIEAVSKAIRRARVGLKDPNKPIGTFIFLGPTGVGKTELCKSLAEVMFGDENSIIRVDMSEYMEKYSVSKIVGSPPGYVGYDEGGQLTEKIRRKPYSVVLFDEIEKAHPDVFNILLQMLDDGRLTDSKGRTVSFKNTIIIMTSNVGASTISKQRTLGFSAGSVDEDKTEYENMKENVMEQLKESFKPEFLNRIDEIIVFHQLNKENIEQIVSVMIDKLILRLNELGIKLEVSNSAKKMIANEGFDKTYGARPLQREIRRRIEDKLSEEILKGTVKKSDTIFVTVEDKNLVFRTKSKEKEELIITK